MKAVVVRRFGGPEALEILDVPVPEPAAGQVRIRVEAAAVNPVDVATRAGWLAASSAFSASASPWRASFARRSPTSVFMTVSSCFPTSSAC